MLKASSSGIVLTRLAHTNGQAIARPCPFHIQTRFSSFSSRFAALVATATSPDPVPHSTRDGQCSLHSRMQQSPANPVRGIGMHEGADGVKSRENIRRTADRYGRLKTNTARLKRKIKRPLSQRLQGPSQEASNPVETIVWSEENENAKLESNTRGRTRRKLPIPDNSNKGHGKENASKPFGGVSGVGSPVQELSVRRLRGIIFDRKSDLMHEAWEAYQRLVAIEADKDAFHDKNLSKRKNGSLFGTKLLRTLANRLIAERRVNPKNSRENFLRLLSVYARLRRERARRDRVPYLRTPEWNSLIHFAGTGLRGKITLEAYNAALDIFDDMMRGVDEARATNSVSLLRSIEPDIYTYTTLLNIALRSKHQPAIDQAMNLLKASKKEPTRVTRLCMMHYRYRQNGLAGARAVLSSLDPYEVGEDGITAFMECAGYEGNLTIVQNLYTALRHSIEVHDDGTFGAIHSGRQLKARVLNSPVPDGIEEYIPVEGIRIPRSLVPSQAMYNYVIQIFAYHGYLPEALQVFTEMLATRRPAPFGGFFQPSYPVFRAIFLGFARYGVKLSKLPTIKSGLVVGHSEWTWDRFSAILDSFFDLGDSMAPSERMVYWIMVSVRKMTGDEQMLREVWQRLNARWYIRKGGRLKDLDIRYGKLRVDQGKRMFSVRQHS